MFQSQTIEKLRINLWDEENRLRAVDITPDAEGVRPIAIYTYDAGGERVLKHSNTSVIIYLNGKKVADTLQTNAMLYPSGMLVAKLGNNGSEEQTLAYTKHYFAGTQRVSSKIGTTENLGDYLQDWVTQGTGGPVNVVNSSFEVLENAEEGVIQVYEEFDIEPPIYDSNPVFIPVQSFVHGGNEIEKYFFHPDHLGSTSYITNLLGEVSQHMEYFAFGETFVEEHRCSNNSPYKFNGKELDEETGWYYYGARYYDPRISIWLSVDPLAEQTMQPYSYANNNPVYYKDPTGMIAEPPSTDVTRNKDGTYTVVGAHDDGDNNIYVVGSNGKRTGETIGTTMQPTDFMNTDDATGEFSGYVGITFDLNNLTVSGTVSPNDHTKASIYGADTQSLLSWGQELFNNEVERQSPATFYGSLKILRQMSINYDPNNTGGGRGSLDFKSSLGLNKYTAISAGNTPDGKPIITTLRAMGNMIFGANMRSTKPYLLGSSKWYYGKVMNEVGAFNQGNNGGNGYNKGFPYYGEHTYSGSYIYYGYFGKFYKK